MWLEWPKDEAENGREELALVTGLNTDSAPPPPGLKMNCGCIEVDRFEGRWVPYEVAPWVLRISIPFRSKYIWLSSGMGCGVETVEGKAELGGE